MANFRSEISSLPRESQQVLAEQPALREFIDGLLETIEELQRKLDEKQQEINELHDEVKRLQDQLHLDSHNSSKPPSTDQSRVRRRVVSLRNSTGRKPGGQKGHPGTTLQAVPNPDHIVLHKVNVCSRCGKDLSSVPVREIEKRQVFDIPPIKLEVTEHQAEVKICPECHTLNRGDFPEGVDQPVQYGERVKSLAVYLNQYQLIPYERVTEIFEDLFGKSISQGTLLNALQTSYHNLEATENRIKDKILDSHIAHFDETGLYLGGKRVWLHDASTEDLTYYSSHSKRGREGMDDAGILPNYKGIAVHDHWEPYNSYENCAHAFCNGHHLRELTRAYEQDGASWAKEMKELLLEIKGEVDHAKSSGKKALESDNIESYHQYYQNILNEALKIYPPEGGEKGPPKRGKKKQSKSKNLLDRLIKYEKETLRFMEDFEVPFDNSLAERDIRMVKVKQKISGCFRSEEGAKYFCRIRGFISTAKKQGKNVMEHLRKALQTSKAEAILSPEGEAV
jgi:transposase